MAIGMLLSPVTADRDKFGDVECTSLTIVDPKTGNKTAILKTHKHGGLLNLISSSEKTGSVVLTIDEFGGNLVLYGNDLNTKTLLPSPTVSISTSKDGNGQISIDGKSESQVFISNSGVRAGGFYVVDMVGNWLAYLGSRNKGGLLNLYGDKIEDGNIELLMNVSEGHVKVVGADGKSEASLSVDAHGGAVEVQGKGEGAGIMGINKYGHGAVSTWKKNGEKFHTLGDTGVVPNSNVNSPIAPVNPTTAVVQSKIDGTFKGWDGDTVVKLMNGQIWKQRVYHYEYHYAYMPDVLIYKAGSGYKMLVDGTDEAVAVERIK